MEELIGKTVVNLYISHDGEYELRFEDSEGMFHCFRAEWDCCNDVWWNHLVGLENLLNSEVLSVEEKGWEEVEATRQEVEEKGIWTIRTAKGYTDIELRNSSNGYYGGDCSYNQKSERTPYKKISEDF